MSVLYPDGAIASDAMPWSLPDGSTYTGDAWPLPDDATSHPRSAGTFTRFLRHWVRERQAVSLLEGIRKCALLPAEILSASTPAMRQKGRLQAGADADIVVFDLETLTDRAEFTAMNRPAEGVKHLIVSGQPLIADGVLDLAARPGQPVRRPGGRGVVPVPVLLVAGFLGAGKTTVVNHLLAHAGGRRIAAVVNDFGAINIDAELIAGAADGRRQPRNGCICCSLEGDLLRTLASLLRRDPRPEAIVIETSGVADPADVVRNLMDPVIWREAPLETVLCIVDATAPAATLDRRAAALAGAGRRRGGAEQDRPRGRRRARDGARGGRGDAAGSGDRRRPCRGRCRCRCCSPTRRIRPPRDVGRRGPAADRFESFSWVSEYPGVAAAAAARDRPAGAEARARQGPVRDGRAARPPIRLPARRPTRHARAGADAAVGCKGGADRVHCRDRPVVP